MIPIHKSGHRSGPLLQIKLLLLYYRVTSYMDVVLLTVWDMLL